MTPALNATILSFALLAQSVFLPKPARPLTEPLGRGDLYTVGLVAQKRPGGAEVVHLFYKGPASAHLEKGDLIVEIEGVAAASMTAAQIYAALIGETTRPVNLVLLRKGERRQVRVPRDDLHETVRRDHWHFKVGGRKLPPASITDAGESLPAGLSVRGLDGAPLALFAPGPRLTLVQFWASWYPPSWTHLRLASEYATKHPGELRVVAVALWDDSTTIKAYLAKYPTPGVAIGIVEDFESPAIAACNVFATGLPARLLLAEDGKVVTWDPLARNFHALLERRLK